MRKFHSFSAILAAVLMLAVSAESAVKGYPAPPGLQQSADFDVKANAASIRVQYWQQNKDGIHIAHLEAEGEVNFEITAGSEIQTYNIRPHSRNIKPSVNGKTLTFKASCPDYFYIEINSYKHLAILASPAEKNVPKEDDENVIYYGPGSHKPGKVILKSNQTVYIAPGAIVHGRFETIGKSNVAIRGRGIISNIGIQDQVCWWENCTGVTVEGVIMQHFTQFAWSNQTNGSKDVTYRDVKVFTIGDPYAVDGINPVNTDGMMIDRCFIRAHDDCIAVKQYGCAWGTCYNTISRNITVQNSVMVGFATSDGFTMGYEMENKVTVDKVKVRNCDILYARGGGKTGGHSGFSLVIDGPVTVEDVLFESLHCEDRVTSKALEFIVTEGTIYGSSKEGEIGRIRNVLIKNCTWERADKPFILQGYGPNNLVENITFENCYVAGKLLTSLKDAKFETKYTKNVQFTTGATDAIASRCRLVPASIPRANQTVVQERKPFHDPIGRLITPSGRHEGASGIHLYRNTGPAIRLP